MSHPTPERPVPAGPASLAALAALLTGTDARATVTDRDGGPYIEMLVARIEAGSVVVDVEIEAASAPGGPDSLHDFSVRRESAVRLAASGLVADPFGIGTPDGEWQRARAELDHLAMTLAIAHADAIRGQLARTASNA